MTKDNKLKSYHNNIHKGHRERLREEMLDCNFNPVNEHKLLEFLLTYCYAQKDVNPIAHNLIKTFGSFSNVLEARYKDLLKVDGIGERTATLLHSLLFVSRYYAEQKSKSHLMLETARDCYENFGKNFANETNEKLLLITLNKKYQVRKVSFISTGTDTEVEFDILKIYDVAREDNCPYIVLIHNHPSGNPAPSPNDDKNTKKLINDLKIFKLVLIDHVIVGYKSYYSYKESGKLDLYNNDK